MRVLEYDYGGPIARDLMQQTSAALLSLDGVHVVELSPRVWSCWIDGPPLRVAVSLSATHQDIDDRPRALF